MFCALVQSVVLRQSDHCGGEGRRGSDIVLQSDRLHQNTVEVEDVCVCVYMELQAITSNIQHYYII